jgi:DNA-binding LacI/PurR family transcriptional regulator
MPQTRDTASLAAEVAERIRAEFLEGGNGRPMRFLPGERDLAGRMGCARTTVRGALSLLAEEGLVRAEQGRGYRVLSRASGLKPGSALAIAMPAEHRREGIGPECSVALQQVLLDAGYRALVLNVDWCSPRDAARQLADLEVWGAALNGGGGAAYRAVHQAGLPCVAIDCADRDLPVDSIMQDNFGGARQAAEYLLERKHREVAWFGPVTASNHSLERFAGARTALTARGLDFASKRVLSEGALDETAARKMLERRDRPTAVLAMWVGQTLAVGRAARSLGLELGKDLDLVGWCTEDKYAAVVEREFGPGQAPPVVVWSSREMADIALARLVWHVREPGLKPLRISVPTRLVTSAADIQEG